jgi:hypothetical protein
MNDDLELLDLTSIDQRHEPDAEFRVALHRRVVAIVERGERPSSSTRSLKATAVQLVPTQEPSAQPRRGNGARILVGAASAAAVAAAISLVIARDGPTAPAEAPRPDVTVGSAPQSSVSTPNSLISTVAAPSPTSDPYGAKSTLTIGNLEPATYAYLDVDGQGFNVRFTVPTGWTWNGRYLSKGGVDLPDGAAIFFYGGPVEVYADPCHWSESGSILSTGFDVIDHLSAQPMRSATTSTARPAPVPAGPADRWAGKVVELTVPDDIDIAGCDGGQFRSWGSGTNVRANQGPGQRDLVWVIDIDGAGVIDDQGSVLVTPPVGGLIIDAASFASTPADVMIEIEAILASIAVGHWG